MNVGEYLVTYDTFRIQPWHNKLKRQAKHGRLDPRLHYKYLDLRTKILKRWGAFFTWRR